MANVGSITPQGGDSPWGQVMQARGKEQADLMAAGISPQAAQAAARAARQQVMQQAQASGQPVDPMALAQAGQNAIMSLVQQQNPGAAGQISTDSQNVLQAVGQAQQSGLMGLGGPGRKGHHRHGGGQMKAMFDQMKQQALDANQNNPQALAAINDIQPQKGAIQALMAYLSPTGQSQGQQPGQNGNLGQALALMMQMFQSQSQAATPGALPGGATPLGGAFGIGGQA